MPFWARALKKNCFDVNIVVKNIKTEKSKYGYRGLYSYRRVRVIPLFPNNFSYCFCMLSEFANVFERKIWRVQVAHLHNEAIALSNPSRYFQLSTNLGKDFFRYLWYCGKKQIECGLTRHYWWLSSTDLGLINWHVFEQSECRNCCLLFRKSRHKPNLESSSKYGFYPDLREKWRRSEHAHASYPRLFFRSPEFSPYKGWEQRRVQGLDYLLPSFSNVAKVVVARPYPVVWICHGFHYPGVFRKGTAWHPLLTF